jgi:hypothetical protein
MNARILGAAAITSLTFGVTYWLARKGLEEGEPAEPVELVELPGGQAGIPSTSEEIEALARIIASEAGSGSLDEQRAIGWTARNRFRGKSVYAKQFPWRAQKGSDPPFSSARPAGAAHRKLAAEILAADQSQDPTGGATAFFEPRMQDIFAKAGAMARAGEVGDTTIDGQRLTDITRFKNYRKTADDIRRSWSKGSALYTTVGRFEFWARASRAKPSSTALGWGGLDCFGADDA